MNLNLKFKKKIPVALGIFFIVIILFLIYEIYIPININSKDTVFFNAERGQGSTIISHKLQEAGLIKWDIAFQFYVFIANTSSKLQAGLYELSKSMNISEIAWKLYKGDIAKNKITIIEGWNLQDIAQNLEKQGIGTKEDLFKLTGTPLNKTASKNYSADFEFLRDKPKNATLEGYFFPDTYEIKKGATIDELVNKILQNFDKKLAPDLRAEIKKQNKSIFEVITVASLIEKEVRSLEDKKIISGIIWKRLQGGMTLNIDATLNYIAANQQSEISITQAKLIDSPYNTYKYRGLPPGPICNPGLESITAALHPKDSNYFYYLSAPDGKTIFSKTLEEHNAAILKYLK